jgi:hypothetical protein
MRAAIFAFALVITAVVRFRFLHRIDRSRESTRFVPGLESNVDWLMIRTLADIQTQILIAFLAMVFQIPGASAYYMLAWLLTALSAEAHSYFTARRFVRRAPPFSPQDYAHFSGLQQWSVRLLRVATAAMPVVTVGLLRWDR